MDGETVRLLNGRGTVGFGRLSLVRKVAAVELARIEAVPAPPPLVLAVGAGDRERFYWLAEKAAELGVTDLLPLETERTRSVASRVREADIPRLARRALEAIKQSGAAWAPLVHRSHTIAELPGRFPAAVRWLAEPDGTPPPEALDDQPLIAVVGPEGGLSGEERRCLLEVGYLPVSLGPHILRFETAAVLAGAAAIAARMRARARTSAQAHPGARAVAGTRGVHG